MKNPIKKRENGQTEPECPRNQHNTDQHYKTSQSLIKIFLQIKLAALTDGTAVKYILELFNLPPFLRALRTGSW